MSISDGASYAPTAEHRPVVGPGEFCFAAAFLDHGHIHGQTNGLLEAGATLTKVYDPDPRRLAAYLEHFPQAVAAATYEELLEDPGLHLIASAAIPNQRAAVGVRAMEAGKHYFTDKSPFTTLEQLDSARQAVHEHKRRYFVYYAERVHNEAAWHAGELVSQGAVGDVIQVLNLAPHRLSQTTRPHWFFEKACYGGIITDIGSHQVEQFMTYAGCGDAKVNFARVDNVNHADVPELEDFGEFSLTGDNGASFYSRVDWFTPDGMPVWGDGRTFILGTQGSLELRKYVDLGRKAPAALILRAGSAAVEEIDCLGHIGFPFFGRLILDVLNGTETAMTQTHTFKAAEISMRAQAIADADR